jgi:acyl-CoA hydrolase
MYSMADWRNKNKDKEIKPEQLKKIINPGSRIYIGTACSEPLALTQVLASEQQYFTDCEILHFLTVSDTPFFDKSSPNRFRHNTLSIIGNAPIRQAVWDGNADFTPVKSSEIPQMLRTYAIPIDICLIQVSPPDEYGFCSLGINVDINRTAIDVAKIIIAQINPQMPKTMGASHIRFDQIHYFLFADTPLVKYNYTYTPFDEDLVGKIGPYLARLIENGSTLNVGLGKIPTSIWRFLNDKKDLAIYSELLVLTPELFDLIERNIINCKQNIFPHVTTGFVLGTEDLYRKLNNNPMFNFLPTDYLNQIVNISHNKRLVSIYGALSVDLMGQVTNNLEGKIYSGIGGEYDFIQGSRMSKNGKTIIALPSTSRDGSISRILPIIEQVAVPATEVHYVVTEWGIARLTGKSIRDRVLQLIGIAHPKFRPELLLYAKQMHYIYEDQILPVTRDGVVVVYPEKYENEIQLNDGRNIFFRPVKPTDETAVQQFFYKLDVKTRIYRFFSPRARFSHEETQLLVNIDYDYNMMVIGLNSKEENAEIICAGSYNRDISGGTAMAEVETTVAEPWRGHGLGSKIFIWLGEIAQEKGIEGFYGEVLSENKNMLQVLKLLPYRVIFQNYGESLEFSYRFNELRDRNFENPIIRNDEFMNFKNPIN